MDTIDLPKTHVFIDITQLVNDNEWIDLVNKHLVKRCVTDCNHVSETNTVYFILFTIPLCPMATLILYIIFKRFMY